jgi:hypothetical protein
MSNWWADKLGPAPTPAPAVPARPIAPAIPVAWPQATPATPGLPATSPQAYPEVTDQAAQYQSSRTTFDRNSGQCPECNSGNYFKPADPRSNSGYRCYDCGYPVVQQTSNMPSMPTGDSGPVKASRQVSTANNYNPSVIVARVGD